MFRGVGGAVEGEEREGCNRAREWYVRENSRHDTCLRAVGTESRRRGENNNNESTAWAGGGGGGEPLMKYSEHAVARECNENNKNKAKKPDRKPDSTLVLKNQTKKIRETERLKSTRVYS
jgi:hypothetical protein